MLAEASGSSLMMVMGALLLALGLAAAALLRRCKRLYRHARHAARHRDAVARLRRGGRLRQRKVVERYWEQVRQASAPVLVTTPDGQILAASAGVREMFGYDTELEGTRMEHLYCNPLDRWRYLDVVLREHGHIRSGEFRMKHRDGHEIGVLTSVRVVLWEGVTYYEGVLTDISDLRAAADERQRLEGQLHLARKLELVGRLASGIAHEINTPMQFIGDNIIFLKRAFGRLVAHLAPAGAQPARPAGTTPYSGEQWRELQADIADALSGSLEGVERVSETVRAMKEFAHPGDVEITSTDLNGALRTTVVVARNEYKHAADLKLELGDIPPVDCRRAELNKVFLNLVVNAAHAIEAGGSGQRGTITIRTRCEAQDVLIEIADTGCGIPEAVLPRIFDPFFTTKAIGKGSGQGLAIAKSVVKAHGGELGVASKVGSGTTFTIRLPASAAAKPVASGTVTPLDLTDPIG